MSDEETTRFINRKSPKLNAPVDDTVAYSTMQAPTGSPKASQTNRDDDYTKIVRPGSSSISGATVLTETAADTFSGEPVVGWLVIVDGPGKGQSMQLGSGMNGIGRAKEARVSLDFGDEEISRQNHASVVYDPKGNKFYLQHGGGINLTYLGDAPVLQPVEIIGRETISIGNTKLVFVPFCGPNFIW
ncbi:hypothetical protein PSHI8_15330 [Polynucleobacter sp. SHI8]|uniref:FHA domain-containing protein n=1 Tax=unclassified Polynucleobacter TaxID=2640945 RepID=UPI0024900EB6|nr:MULTISPECIES: FHA domain-containing protein [unclassified Polynucleobacter]BDW11450.1 hypothetical protein PSHI2_15320 [Polynucleobacter sp. SHI2]BDW13897.1 hypothetical protein PSHI8_15330 [Polynucleobacter sp. SHI8]